MVLYALFYLLMIVVAFVAFHLIQRFTTDDTLDYSEEYVIFALFWPLSFFGLFVYFTSKGANSLFTKFGKFLNSLLDKVFPR